MKKKNKAVAMSAASIVMAAMGVSTSAHPASATTNTNLLTNGTFSNGTNGWVAYKNVTTGTNGACLNISSGDSAYSSALQQYAPMTAGRTYTLSFDVTSTSAFSSNAFKATVGDGVDENWYQQMGRNFGLNSGTNHESFTFTAGHTYRNAKVTPIELTQSATSSANVCVTNVSLVDVTPAQKANLMTNGNFTDKMAGWITYGSQGSITAGTSWDYNLKAGDSAWSLGLFQSHRVEAGHSYTLSYDVWSDSGNVTLAGGVHQENSDGGATWASWPVNITPTRKTITQSFTTPMDYNKAHMTLLELQQTATTTATIHVANVKLIDTTSATSGLEYTTEVNPVGHTTRVEVNQLGYLPNATKQATIFTSSTSPLTWTLKNSGGSVVATGTTTPKGTDSTTGQNVQTADFSSVKTYGKGYVLFVDGTNSFPFDIGSVYNTLSSTAMNWFYTQQAGTAIDGSQLGDTAYTRAASSTSDSAATCLPSTATDQQVYSSSGGTWTCPTGYTHDVSGGWYDAGDTGQYVATGTTATWALLDSFQHNPTAAKTTLTTGTHTAGIPDELSAAKVELDWLLKMQVPSGQQYAGMVYSKVGNVNWAPSGVDPAYDTSARYLYRPSTAGTYKFAAVAAQAARIWQKYDSTYAAKLLAASRTAYNAASSNPTLIDPDATYTGTGAYADSDSSDDAYWAAAELYLTTGESSFANAVNNSSLNTTQTMYTWRPLWSYNDVANLGKLDLAVESNNLSSRSALQTQLKNFANDSINVYNSSDWGLAGNMAFWWGSTREFLPQAIGLGLASQMTGNTSYKDAAVDTLNWVLGRNGVGTSFVAGFGSQFARNGASIAYQHADNSTMPYVPNGTLSGGPDSSASSSDDAVLSGSGCVGQMCWVDNPHSYRSTENSVDGQAMLEWMSQYANSY